MRRSGQAVLVITHAAHGMWLKACPFGSLDTLFINSEPCAPGIEEKDRGQNKDSCSREASDWKHLTSCWTLVQNLTPRIALIVFNLFSLEVWQKISILVNVSISTYLGP